MLFIEPSAGMAPIIHFIEKAQKRLDINMYLMTDRRALGALRAAVQRGVNVQVIIARQPYGGRPHGETRALRATGAQVRYAPPRFTGRYRFDHAKYMVSGHASEIGTANLSWSAFHRNREYIWVGHSARVAGALGEVFRADWSRHQVGSAPRRTLVLAPGATDALVSVLDAPGPVCVESEELGHDRSVLAALRAKAGEVRLLLPQRLSRYDLGIARALTSYGVHVRTLNRPYLHAKLIAGIHGAFIGSENLSPTSLHHNREVGIVLRGRDAQILRQQCERDWQKGHRP